MHLKLQTLSTRPTLKIVRMKTDMKVLCELNGHEYMYGMQVADQ